MSFFYSLINNYVAHSFRAPLETVQFRLQCQQELLKSNDILIKYQDFSDCFHSIWIEEGPLTFWKGNLLHAIRFSVSHNISLFLKENSKSDEKQKNNQGKISLLQKIFGDRALILIPLVFIYPLDVARILVVNDLKGRFNNSFSCISYVYKRFGLQGLYTGFMISFFGIVLYRAFYFYIYQVGKAVLFQDSRPFDNFFKGFLWGFCVTAISGIITYPFDMIRKRMVASLLTEKPYKNALECINSVWKDEGFGGFFVGVGLSVLGGLVSAIGTMVIQGFISKRPDRNKRN